MKSLLVVLTACLTLSSAQAEEAVRSPPRGSATIALLIEGTSGGNERPLRTGKRSTTLVWDLAAQLIERLKPGVFFAMVESQDVPERTTWFQDGKAVEATPENKRDALALARKYSKGIRFKEIHQYDCPRVLRLLMQNHPHLSEIHMFSDFNIGTEARNEILEIAETKKVKIYMHAVGILAEYRFEHTKYIASVSGGEAWLYKRNFEVINGNPDPEPIQLPRN